MLSILANLINLREYYIIFFLTFFFSLNQFIPNLAQEHILNIFGHGGNCAGLSIVKEAGVNFYSDFNSLVWLKLLKVIVQSSSKNLNCDVLLCHSMLSKLVTETKPLLPVRDFTIYSNTNGLGLRSNAIKDLCSLILHQLIVR